MKIVLSKGINHIIKGVRKMGGENVNQGVRSYLSGPLLKRNSSIIMIRAGMVVIMAFFINNWHFI